MHYKCLGLRGVGKSFIKDFRSTAALQTTARGDSAVAMQVARWLFPELHADASAWNVVLLDGHMCGRQAVDKLEVHRSSCYNVVLEFVSQLT
jgi:hypothetical protein